MAVKVIDASALAAIIFAEPDGRAVATSLETATLAAPTLLPFEMANICLKKMRLRPEARATVLVQFAAWDQFGIELLEIDPYSLPELAEQFGLTSYDASYLSLAQQLDAELVTLDRRLARAAGTSPPA